MLLLQEAIRNCINGLADLEGPRQTIRIAQDESLLQFYSDALAEALTLHPGALKAHATALQQIELYKIL